jgi:tRNA A37 N6-isopentenylltransferase MiaA
MKHALKNSISENMHALLECTFVDYANQLRAKYPGRIIRNAAVFASGVPEFARLGLIELVDARRGIPEGIPDFLVRTIKRAKHQPIWIPGVNFPDDSMDIYDQMKASLQNNEVIWEHIPSKRSVTWRTRVSNNTTN